MQQIRTVIADDEPLAISNLKAKLAPYPNIQIDTCFDNGDEVLSYLQTTAADLVFLDIQMPGIKGIEVLKQLNKSSAMAAPLIILVTAYDNYAFSAYEHFAFDYLLKPVSRQRLAQTLLDAKTALNKQQDLQQAQAQTQNKLTFKTGSSTLLLDDVDILMIEAAGNYMCVHTLSENLIIRETIKELMQRLPSHFAQVHRSTIVNLHHVHKVQPHNNDYQLQLSNGQTVTASRRYKADWTGQLLQSR
jgi:two-component system, LytTR family, response regulator